MNTMEALSVALQPYKSLVGSVASVVTIAQFFSGALICKDIYQRKSTSGVSAVPFIGGVTIGILMLQYSAMLGDIPMFVVNVVAVILNAIYGGFYFMYSEDASTEFYKPISYGIALMAILLGYTKWEDPSLIEFRYGFAVTILMLLLLGAPLLEVKEIIAQKDASSIPFPITSSAAVVSFLWLLYGVILLNYFMIVQNVLGLILCVAQLMLYFKYPHSLSAQ